MSTALVLEQLKHMSDPERLTVIEFAARLVRGHLAEQTSDTREERNRRMREAALAAKDLYEPGGELDLWN